MRRALFSITAVLGVVMLPASAGVAAVGTRGPVLQAQAKPKAVCTVTDPRLVELSGLVATKSGYIVVNDSTDLEERRKIFYLNQDCAVTNAVDYSGAGPYDTEDLALSPDRKTLWIADTGDNITSAQRRERVALWSMPVSGNKPPSLHRLAYPEKAPHDAEALLIADDGTPIIITKSLSGSKIFVPDGPLQTDNETPVPMKEVGRLKLPRTSTDNLLGTSGRVLVTGAARSPDGSKVVVRTYADAFEFDVPNGDIVKALTDGKPRATALADPFGEAIAYTADGKWFLTVSEIADVASATDLQILRYQPSTTVATEAPVPGAGAPGSEDSFFQSLSLQQITYLIAGVGVVGVLLVAAGVTGILRARRKPAAKGAADDAEGAAAGEDGGRRRRGAAAVNEPGGRGEPVPAASAGPPLPQPASTVARRATVARRVAARSTAGRLPPAACTAAPALRARGPTASTVAAAPARRRLVAVGLRAAASTGAAVRSPAPAAVTAVAPRVAAVTAARPRVSAVGVRVVPVGVRVVPVSTAVAPVGAGTRTRAAGGTTTATPRSLRFGAVAGVPRTRAAAKRATANRARANPDTTARAMTTAGTTSEGTTGGATATPATTTATGAAATAELGTVAGPAGPATARRPQTRRSTATTRPMMLASSPRIGSKAALAGISQTCPSRGL